LPILETTPPVTNTNLLIGFSTLDASMSGQTQM
jgi:hypothetical protein